MRAHPRSGIVALVLALVAALSVVAIGASADPAASAVTKAVSIANFAYSPATVTVNVGDTVKWTNNDGFAHSVTADGGSFDSSPSCPASGCLGAGATFSHVFTTAGTFKYHCRVHGFSMAGTVIVKSTTTSHPTITAVNPAKIQHGKTNVKVTITGTHFATGIKIKIAGTGITITSPHRVDAAHLTMNVSVASGAPRTKRNVTVTNVDGGTFTKTAALAIT